MDIHERLEAFWVGEKPDRIPYTVRLGGVRLGAWGEQRSVDRGHCVHYVHCVHCVH